MIEDATKPIAELNAPMEPHITPVFSGPGDDAVSLDLREAAFILGKSMRSLERSLTGKWGNRLPDGWAARRQIVDGVETWRIIPPEGFNLEPLWEQKRGVQESHLSHGGETKHLSQGQPGSLGVGVSAASAHLFAWKKEEEVLTVLKELAGAHRELAEERRSHIQDLRLLGELQSSMRLLECNTAQTSQLKAELAEAQKDLVTLKNEYQELLKMPWWKRIFKTSN